MSFKKAFTMIEMIFVIVVIGILAAIAIPRLSVTRDDAIVVKGRSQIASIRSGISLLKSQNLLEGKSINGSFYPRVLDKNVSPSVLFYDAADQCSNCGNVLEYGLPIKDSDGNWERISSGSSLPEDIKYKFHILGSEVEFTYYSSSGKFDCNHSIEYCKDLTE